MDYLQYQTVDMKIRFAESEGFKPYYKWITFNTKKNAAFTKEILMYVLNLIINGLPSILPICLGADKKVLF